MRTGEAGGEGDGEGGVERENVGVGKGFAGIDGVEWLPRRIVDIKEDEFDNMIEESDSERFVSSSSSNAL